MSDGTWIGSLDVDSYVKTLMQKESDQIDKVSHQQTQLLSTEQSDLTTKISAYGQIQNLLQSFQTSLTQLTTTFNPSYQVASSNTSVATAQASGSIAAGTHAITVTHLAQAESIASAVVSSSSDALGKTDTLQFTIGSANLSVNVGASDSLQTIADNINNAAESKNFGVLASVVSTGANSYQLLVSSSQTGLSNAVAITETGVGANSLALSTEVTAARDSQFTFDNLSFVTPTATNVIAGLNITLLSEGSSNISVTRVDQTATASTAINNVLNAYNQLTASIEQFQASAKAPDPSLALVLTTLQSSMEASLGSGSITSLADVGISVGSAKSIPITLSNGQPGTFYTTGQLTVNTDPELGPTLAEVLADHFSEVQTLLTSDNGLMTTVGKMLASGTGSIWQAINDPIDGALPAFNNQLSDIKKQIADKFSVATAQKSALLEKYGKLDVMLGQMQTQSQYLTQQIQLMNK